jgi:hypothetical protein
MVALPAGSASAGTETLKRSVSNITQAPLDLVLSPVVAGKTIYTNLTNIEDSRAVRIVYPPIGIVWLTSVQAGAAVLRGISGLFELLPGVVLLPFEREMTPLYDPAERGNALVDRDTPPFHIKFGVDYTTPPV